MAHVTRNDSSGTGARASSEAVSPRRDETERATIYCDRASKYARAALAEGGYRFVDEPAAADLLWMRNDYDDWFERLKPLQLLNHLPNADAVADKGSLAEHLRQFDRVQSKYKFGMNDLVQETYCLYIPEERARFFAQLPPLDSKENLWILKPCDFSRGRGIRILWKFDELRERYAHPEKYDFDPRVDRYVIQRYIRNPLLLNGRKSEIRIYWLIACVDPLLVLVYREGTVRLNSKPFILDDFDNTLIHVTNVFQQKSHPEYDPSVILKWGFSEWERYLHDRGLAPENYIEAHLMPRIKQMLSFVADAAAASLVKCPRNGLFFTLFGADIIFDDALHPWLTEIQISPGLSFDDPVKQKVIPPMLKEAVAIVLEVQRRKSNGAGLENLEAVGGFQWVVGER